MTSYCLSWSTATVAQGLQFVEISRGALYTQLLTASSSISDLWKDGKAFLSLPGLQALEVLTGLYNGRNLPKSILWTGTGSTIGTDWTDLPDQALHVAYPPPAVTA